MPLSRGDFVNAAAGRPIDIPPEAFGPPEERGPEWPDFPDLRRAVDWFKTYLTPDEWEARRRTAFIRLHVAAIGLTPAGDRGRFFDDSDTFGWYLFLADAFLDHVWNYEPIFGSRVVPTFAAIGRNLPILKGVSGVDERVRRLAGPDRSQPNGGLFELLVAAAYGRAGAQVTFRPEEPGRAKTYDFDIELGGREFAVECKRLETGEYGERERARMRQVWRPACDALVRRQVSTFCNADFLVPVSELPDRYLFDQVERWRETRSPSLLWQDEFCSGVVGEMDLSPLREALRENDILAAGTRLHELLTGRYIRHANYLQVIRFQAGMSPRYIGDCDLAILLRWQTSAQAATSAKARDVLRKLAEANRQLPSDKPSVVHIGFEAVEGDAVEQVRYEKILASTSAFDPEGKPLRYVYCHYFVPESPPDEAWAFDETVQWIRITGTEPRPLDPAFLIMPNEDGTRSGPHWRL